MWIMWWRLCADMIWQELSQRAVQFQIPVFPGMVGGVSKERVIHSPGAGIIRGIAHIADIVEKGQILAYVGEVPVEASITGVLRGIIKDGYYVPAGMKIADIDPRKEEKKNCFTISDKARCIAGKCCRNFT